MAIRTRTLRSLSFYPSNESPPDHRVELLPQRDISRRDEESVFLGGLSRFSAFSINSGGVAVADNFAGLGRFKGVQRAANAYAIRYEVEPPVGTPTKLCVDGQIGPLTVRFVAAMISHALTQGPIKLNPPTSVTQLANAVTDYSVSLWSLVNMDPVDTSTIAAGDRDACASDVIVPQGQDDAPVAKKKTKMAGIGLLILAGAALYFASTPNEGDLGDCGCDG